VEIRVAPTESHQIPYEIRLIAFGQFTVADEKIERPRAAQLVAVSGVSIIYSAAREYLMVLTGRGPWGAFQLPTVSFVDARVNQVAPAEADKSGVSRSQVGHSASRRKRRPKRRS
jgi:hypothetical protein